MTVKLFTNNVFIKTYIRHIFLFVLLVLIVSEAGCSGGSKSPKKVGDIKKGPMPEGATWSGTYFTNWGTMKLTQTGASVVGTFGERNGIIEGTADGNILVFHWSEDQRSSLSAKPKRIEGSGVFVYYVIKAEEGKLDEHKIKGTWGYGNKREGAGTWSGYKSTKDIREAERMKLITKGAAVKTGAQATGSYDSDYLPPPAPEKKKSKLTDIDDIPPPAVK